MIDFRDRKLRGQEIAGMRSAKEVFLCNSGLSLDMRITNVSFIILICQCIWMAGVRGYPRVAQKFKNKTILIQQRKPIHICH